MQKAKRWIWMACARKKTLGVPNIAEAGVYKLKGADSTCRVNSLGAIKNSAIVESAFEGYLAY